MSKITPKNLSYDASLPPFLQRLRAVNTSHDGRSDFQAARPKKRRNSEDEAEDEPVYFDPETGESLSKSEWAKDINAKQGAEESIGRPDELPSMHQDDVLAMKPKEAVASIGLGKKRKSAKKVVSRTADDDDHSDSNADASVGVGAVEETRTTQQTTKPETLKSAKRSKKIKLAFEDNE